MRYRLSRYVKIYRSNGSVFLYNSLNGLKAELYDTQIVNEINLLERGKAIDENSISRKLIDYGIAVPQGSHELSVAIAQNEKILNCNEDELGLIILTTRSCNFKCVYCYESHNSSMLKYSTQKALINAVCDYYSKHPLLKKISVEWFGGEPLVNIDAIVYISDELIKFCNLHAIEYSASITTNGYLLDDDVQTKLLERKVSTFQITIDGTEEIHNSMRPLKGGLPTWKTIIGNLLNLKKREDRFTVRLRTNYSYKTLIHISEYIELMKSMFGDDQRFCFHFIKINRPEGNEMDCETVDTETDKTVIGMNINTFAENEMSMAVYYLNFSPCGGVCYARRGNVFAIDTDGTIMKCTEYLDNPNNWIGTISKGLFDVDFSKNARWLNPDPNILVKKGCYDCFNFPSCAAGVCPAAWAINNNLQCNPYYQYTDKYLKAYFDEYRRKK